MSAAPATPPAPIASGTPARCSDLPRRSPASSLRSQHRTANGLTPPKSKPPPAVWRSSQPRRREAQSRMKVSDAKPGVLLQEHLLRHLYNTVVPGSVSTSPPAFIWITPPFRSPKFNLFFVRNAVHLSLVAPPVRVAFWSVVCQSACSVFGCRPKTSQTSCLFRVVGFAPSHGGRGALRCVHPSGRRSHSYCATTSLRPLLLARGSRQLGLYCFSLNALRLGLAMPLLECLYPATRSNYLSCLHHLPDSSAMPTRSWNA